MAFTETPKEKEKRLAFYAKNKAVADDKEAKADAEIKRKFNETTNTDTSKNTNPMGDTYKKGGKIMNKKAKRYNEGGELEFETKQGPNKNIDSETRRKAMEMVNLDADAEPRITKDAPKAKPRAKAKPKTNAATTSHSRMNAMGDTYKKGGSVGSASRRADGCATKGKTRGRMV